jgi:hypothetical protein
MKKYLFCIVIVFFTSASFSQIINHDFEISRDTIPNMPQGWGSRKVEGFSISLDSCIKYSGLRSLHITGAPTTQVSSFLPFSQLVIIKVDRLKKINISSYVKTQMLTGSAQLWSQVWDKDNRVIGFQNSEMQNSQLIGNNNWTKLQLKLTVDTNAKKLLLGGLLFGSGLVWFDSFAIENDTTIHREPSVEVKKFITNFIEIVRHNSIYKDSINWAELTKSVEVLSDGILSVNESQTIIDYVISKLREAGDKHSFFQNKVNAQKYALKNSITASPMAKLLKEEVGYISVPGFASVSDTASVHFASKIQSLIRTIDAKYHLKGWIVDLRKDDGGNVYPMIAGLGPLLGEGTLGYFEYPNQRTTNGQSLFYRNGSSGINGIKSVTAHNPYKMKNIKSKIAILVGEGTASSGEMTAICFLGKKNTKLFGQKTAGFTTANQGFNLANGACLYLATSYMADRTKKKYLDCICPDVTTQENEKGELDSTITTALAWIKN